MYQHVAASVHLPVLSSHSHYSSSCICVLDSSKALNALRRTHFIHILIDFIVFEIARAIIKPTAWASLSERCHTELTRAKGCFGFQLRVHSQASCINSGIRAKAANHSSISALLSMKQDKHCILISNLALSLKETTVWIDLLINIFDLDWGMVGSNTGTVPLSPALWYNWIESRFLYQGLSTQT